MKRSDIGKPWEVELSGLGYQYGEGGALRKCPVDIFSEEPACRAGGERPLGCESI